MALEPVPEKCARFSDKDRLKIKRIEPVPEKCARFSDKERLKIKGLEHRGMTMESAPGRDYVSLS